MSGILLDSISEQIRGMQAVTRLLTEKLEKVYNQAYCPLLASTYVVLSSLVDPKSKRVAFLQI